MTKRQLREYKQANQRRKQAMIARTKAASKIEKGYYARLGLIQNGRYS